MEVVVLRVDVMLVLTEVASEGPPFILVHEPLLLDGLYLMRRLIGWVVEAHLTLDVYHMVLLDKDLHLMIVFFGDLVDGAETLLDADSALTSIHAIAFLPDGIERADAELMDLGFKGRTVLAVLLLVLDALIPLRVDQRPLHARRQLFVLSWLGSLGL